MFDPLSIASISSLLFEAMGNLAQFINSLSVLQWGILSGCGVIFGFLCLKGSNIA